MLKNIKITVYITGSVAAYKSLILVRMLIKSGASVRIVMTKTAQEFISKLSFQTLTKNDVIVDGNLLNANNDITHITIADNTDLAIVVPATADFIAKIANGIADDMASTTFLATNCKKIIVPAMNPNMLANPATQRNLKQLKEDGNYIFKSSYGLLAEGYDGNGRMMEPTEIMKKLHDLLMPHPSTLQGKRIIVTAGGTIEPLDPVRYLTNNSSGKMGYAIAKVARNLGAKVTLITAPTKLNRPNGIKIIDIKTTEELENQILEHLKNADILIMAAAVADFKPVKFNQQKIKKNANGNISIELQPTRDILKDVAKVKQKGQIIVGFAAETENLSKFAYQKLLDKKLDLMVANDVSNSSVGFNGDNNQVIFFRKRASKIKTGIESKAKIAEKLLAIVSHFYH